MPNQKYEPVPRVSLFAYTVSVHPINGIPRHDIHLLVTYTKLGFKHNKNKPTKNKLKKREYTI